MTSSRHIAAAREVDDRLPHGPTKPDTGFVTAPPPAGWYVLPGSTVQRWWDGTGWVNTPGPETRGPGIYRPQSPASVCLATLLGTPVAGGIVLALNYWKWGQKVAALAAAGAGLIGSLIVFWLAWIAPANVPAAVVWMPAVLGSYFLAKWLQGRRIDAHRAVDGQQATLWVGAGIGVAFLTLFAGCLVGWTLSSGVDTRDTFGSVAMGHGQEVFYARGATREDAREIGVALTDVGYFDDSMPGTVLIAGQVGSAREISFVIADGAWDDEFVVLCFRELVEDIAPAIGGDQVSLRLLDSGANEKKRLDVEFTAQPSSR